jgi:hypothetical protein
LKKKPLRRGKNSLRRYCRQEEERVEIAVTDDHRASTKALQPTALIIKTA